MANVKQDQSTKDALADAETLRAIAIDADGGIVYQERGETWNSGERFQALDQSDDEYALIAREIAHAAFLAVPGLREE